MAKNPTRRTFLRAAPLAAAAVALPLSDKTLSAQSAPLTPYKLISAEELAQAEKGLLAKPGNFDLFSNPALPFTCVLTVEEKKAAKEFEWHEHRDHIFQILDGATTYELGGTPEHGHSTGPGEWLAPSSANAAVLHLRKGDVLIVPRGTPHRRTTATSVTFCLISTTGNAPA